MNWTLPANLRWLKERYQNSGNQYKGGVKVAASKMWKGLLQVTQAKPTEGRHRPWTAVQMPASYEDDSRHKAYAHQSHMKPGVGPACSPSLRKAEPGGSPQAWGIPKQPGLRREPCLEEKRTLHRGTNSHREDRCKDVWKLEPLTMLRGREGWYVLKPLKEMLWLSLRT